MIGGRSAERTATRARTGCSGSSRGAADHPKAQWFAQIGTVDRHSRNQVDLGNPATFVAPASGELVCYGNDLSWMHCKNSGEVRSTLVREPDGAAGVSPADR